MSFPTAPLGSLCEVLDRLRKPITKSARTPGEYPYYGATGIVDYVDGYLFDEPLVLLGEDGAKWGPGEKSAFAASGRYWVNNHAHIVRPNRAKLLDDWLIFYLNWQDLSPFITGLTVPKLNQERMREIPVPVPPLEEQRRIVAVLDEAFAAIATAIANTEKNLANAQELLQAATVSRMRRQEEGWTKKPLGSFCDIYQPETISKKQMSDDGQYPVFGANGKIGRYDRFNHEQSQLLVTCRGATCGSINISEPFSWITGNAMVVRPRSGELRLGLLRRIFETGFDFSKVITGAAQPQITLQSLAPSKVAFPTDLGEQKRLEAELDEIDAEVKGLENSYEAKLRELAELKQSLLNRAFSGELTEREPLAA